MKKIIFINPPLTLQDRYSSFDLGGTVMPPMGLANLAAITRKYGYDTSIIDGEILRLSYDEIYEIIKREKPDYIGLTAVTLSICKAARIAELVKVNFPNIITIIGGPHITAVPEKTFEIFKYFDIAVLGEGDITIIELLDALENNKSLKTIKGLMFRDNEKLFFTENRELITDLDTLPLPAWDLLPDIGKVYSPPINAFNKFPVGYLVTSRGCYGRCAFCSRAVYKDKVRFHSAEYIVEMIKDLIKKYNVKEILFDDDEFLVDKSRIKKLAQLFKDQKINISWSCLSRIPTVNQEILEIIKKMGCWQISFGIESGNQEVLKFLKKATTLEQIEKVLTLTKNSGIKTKGFFMIGHPIDTHQTINDTINFAIKIKLDDLQSSVFTPLPGSEIYEIAHKYGKFDNDWEKMNYWNILFIPNNLTANDLRNSQKKLFRKFYFRPKIIFTQLMRIKGRHQFIFLLKAFIAFIKFVFTKNN